MDDRPNSPSARDIAYHIHPMTNLVEHEKKGPHFIVRGEGIYVYDDAGKKYIEGLAGLWCTSLGFSEKRLVDAATKQLSTLPYYHNYAHKTAGSVADLAEMLVEMMPVPMSKVFFTNSGSEANDTQIKMVWYYHNAIGKPKKKKIIGRQQGYHGNTIAAASLCGLPYMHQSFDLPIANILHTDSPQYWQLHKEGETEEEFSTRMAKALEDLILKEGPDTVAAFIAEPVMGAGGVILPPKGYFEKVQAVLKKYDILFIADEVICGFCRTGNMFGTETFKLKPDMITVAKALSSAYVPIAGAIVSKKIYEAIRDESGRLGTFGTGFTYTGHPVAAAVALETLKIYKERDTLGHVRRVSPRFLKHINGFADHPLVGNVRGVGLIAGVQLARDKKKRQLFDPKDGVGAFALGRAAEHGLIVRMLKGDSLAFCPPLIITEAEIDDMFGRFKKALDETLDMVKKKGLM